MAMQPLTQPGTMRLQFEAAVAFARDELFAACSDSEERFDGFARLCRYRADANPAWHFFDLPTTIAAATRFQPRAEAEPAFVFLSEEGDAMLLPIGGEARTERIAGAGLWSDDSEGWGYLAAIAQIGERLHACGGGGQVYRRDEAGTWEHIDAGLLRGRDDKDGLSLEAIAGPHEQSVYVGGWNANVNDGVLLHWNGRQWTPAASGMPAIASIHVEREDSVWACGRGGTLLHGNHVDGFKDVSAIDDARAYVDVASYDGQIYLATETGLYLHANGAAHRIRTGLEPEYEDGHLLRVVDGVLWSIGYADIARFDGTAWERIPFPGNPPIR